MMRFAHRITSLSRSCCVASDPREYDKYYLAELTELATRYSDLVEFWLDAAGSAGHVYDFKE
jgi:alpha-L-fucosidase